MVLAAAATWALVSIPLAVAASRPNLADVLRTESRSAASSAGSARVRRALTVAEVALAVLLLAAGTLYSRTYLSLVALEKGFDSANLAVLSLTLPMQSYPTEQARSLLEASVKTRMAARGDVIAVTGGAASLPPSRGEAYQASALEIDGRAAGVDELTLRIARVDDAFFSTLGIPLRRGREPNPRIATEAVVDELMARALWPAADAIDGQIRLGRQAFTVVGVAGHVRNDADEANAPSETSFQIYVPRQPPPEVPAAATRAINDLPLYGFLDFAVRLRPDARFEDVLADVRAIDSRFRLRMQWMDDVYASRFEDTRLATTLVSAFAALSFVLAIIGIYGVMAHLVAGRAREIGIRLALGATRADVGRLVLGSSTRLVLVGAGLGVTAALATTRWTESQFFGAAATDPWTHLGVVAVVVGTALLASWAPARRAARVDPALTLRAE
jgi:predicted permease